MRARLRWTRLLAVLLAFALVAAACGDDDDAAEDTTTTTAAAADDGGAAADDGGETTTTTAAASDDGGAAGATELSILWFAWPPCDALGELAAGYPDATVTVNCVDISIWRDTAFADFAAQSGNDIVIADSQWVGEAVVGGHFLNLTDFMATRIETDDYVPAALSAYGEYPLGSQDYWGVAIEGDTQMLVYRKDLFDAAGLQPPTSWSELRDQAATFAAGDAVPFGYATHFCGTVACYDQIQTAWNQIAWSFGGELWDSNTATVEGILNSPENVAALELFTELFNTAPDGAANFTFNEVVSALCNGQVAMGNIWFGFAPGFLDPEGCAESANLAYAVLPGETEHVLSLGGMGMSVSTYSQNQEAALDFIEWVQTSEQQLKWAELGGFSARISVLESDTFKNATPYNPFFAESYVLVRDFWNVPEYIQLLEPQGTFLNAAVSGQMSAQDALDEIAVLQQEIFDAAG